MAMDEDTSEDVFEDVLHELEDEVDDLGASISSDEIKNVSASETSYSFRSSLLQFLKQIASATGDLSQLTCPAIMLSGKSLVEYSQYWASRPDLLMDIGSSSNPFDRMIAVTKWFLSTLWGNYASRSSKDGYERKPYNPILGEQFFATWTHPDDGKTRLICEQVSHHPPITAFHIENDSSNVIVNGFNGQKTRFTGTSIKVNQVGQIQVLIKDYNEDIRITYPELYIRGLFTGAPFLELTGTSYIQSNTGASAEVHFIPKPWFSGEYHMMRAVINGPNSSRKTQSSNSFLSYRSVSDQTNTEAYISDQTRLEECLYLSGKWTEVVFASTTPFLDPDLRNNGSKEPEDKYSTSGTLLDTNSIGSETSDINEPPYIFYDFQSYPMLPMDERSLNDIQNNIVDTHHVWGQVTAALQQKNYDLATALKTTIEEEQRSLRRMRLETDEVWNPKFFEYAGGNEESRSTNLLYLVEFPWKFIGKI